MLAAIKMEVMTPTVECPDEGSIGIKKTSHFSALIILLPIYFLDIDTIYIVNTAIEFHMPPICSPLVRPGRPAEAAEVISKQLSDTIFRYIIIACRCPKCGV